jgi:uncharacterized membrane protein YfcA
MEETIFILLILAFAMLVGSTLGFGDSLTFIPLAGIFLDVRIATVLMGFWSTLLSILNATKYRSYIDKPFLKKYISPGIFGVILGAILIVVAPIQWIELFLGLFIIVYLIVKIRDIKREEQEKQEKLTEIPDGLFYTGAFSYGILSGLIGAAGPINVALLERTGHERESFIGNFAIISALVSSVKLVIYSVSGLFPLEFFVLFLVGIVVIFIVTRFGHWLTPKIPKREFQILIMILMAIISIRLIVVSLFFY